MRYITRLLSLLALGLLMVGGLPVRAQSQQIAYGAYTVAALDANVIAAYYTFQGEQGDNVILSATALTAALNPRVSLLDASSATLAVSNNDPFMLGTQNAAFTYTLPQSGVYSILIEAEAQSAGRYLLRLDSRTLPVPQALPLDVVTRATVSPDVQAVAYSVDSAQGSDVRVSSPVAGLDYALEVLDADGQTVAVLHGGDGLTGGAATIPPNTGTYTAIVRSLNPTVTATLELTLKADASAAPEAAPAPQEEAAPTEGSAETVAPTPAPESSGGEGSAAPSGEGSGEGEAAAPTDTRCNVTPKDGGVVIRQNPTTDAAAIASIPMGEFRYADGTDGAWIRLVGGGWVSSGVVELRGYCGGLPLVTGEAGAGAAPAAPAPTSEPGAIGQRN